MADNSGLIISALEITDPRLAQSIDAQNSYKALLVKSGARVDLFRKYEAGDHRADITDQMRNMLRLVSDNTGLSDFNDNQCEVIVDKEASRIFVSSVTADDTAADWLSETLERNRWESVQGEVFRAAVRDATSYIMVGTDALWTSEPAYDGFSGVVVIYSGKTRKPIWACKLWSEAVLDGEEDAPDTEMKIVVYQNDAVSYFIGEVGGSEVSPSKTEEVQAWTLGEIPIAAFVNKRDNYRNGGKSELRVAIPLQDVLNRSLHSLVMAEELAAYGVRYSIGMELDLEGVVPGGVIGLVLRDGDGNEIKDITPEHVDFLKAISVGQFEPTDLTQYLNVLDKLVEHIAYNTQTPLLGITSSGNLSGDALQRLEVGLIGKVERFQRENGDSVRYLLRLTAKMQNEFDNDIGNAPKDLGTIGIMWKDAELLNVNERMNALGKAKTDNPNLFSDDFYRRQYGVLLKVSKDDIEAENQIAKERQGLVFDAMTGAAGNVPSVA